MLRPFPTSKSLVTMPLPVVASLLKTSLIVFAQESVVASIQRGRKQLIPHGGTEIKANDSITIIADPELEPALAALLK